MLTIVIFGVLITCIAMLWNEGLWGNAITLINIVIAGMIATNYFEPLAGIFEGAIGSSFTYMMDFLALWAIFVITYLVLRLVTDKLTQHKVRFKMPVEQVGRVVSAMAAAWAMTCFVVFSFHLAPLPENCLGGGFNAATPVNPPESRTDDDGQPYLQRARMPNHFLGLAAPDRQWLAFVHSRSRTSEGGFPGALSRWWGKRQFDSDGRLIIKYNARRRLLELRNKTTKESIRVNP